MNLTDTAFDCLIRPLRVRGKFRFLAPLLPRTGTRTAKVFGHRMSLDLADVGQRGVYLGSYEFNETRWVRSILHAGDTAIDVGANCGYYTALFSRIVGPSGQVLALEPNPRLADRLEHFAASNGLSHVEIIRAGASDSHSCITLYIPPAEDHNESATMAKMPSWAPVDVPIVRLDKICGDRNVTRVKLLKLDIEGHEHRALSGMEDLLRKGVVRYLLTELNHYWLKEQGSSPRALLNFCREMGFRRTIHMDHPDPEKIGSVLLEWTPEP